MKALRLILCAVLSLSLCATVLGCGGDNGSTETETEPRVRGVAHRGYSSEAPENTLAAYRLAAEKGFKYAECDVSFTSDGVAVLLHDGSVDRTSNGSGKISELTYEQVRELDFGYSDKFGDKYAGEKIPTFSEFLALCKQLKLRPYIEIKNGATIDEVSALVDEVVAQDYLEQSTWISFFPSALMSVVDRAPTARCGFLTNGIDSTTFDMVDLITTGQNQPFVSLNYTKLTDETIAACKERNIPLEVWTVNDEEAIKSLNEYITGVTSDIFNASELRK